MWFMSTSFIESRCIRWITTPNATMCRPTIRGGRRIRVAASREMAGIRRNGTPNVDMRAAMTYWATAGHPGSDGDTSGVLSPGGR
jgi:hypothetical protein